MLRLEFLFNLLLTFWVCVIRVTFKGYNLKGNTKIRHSGCWWVNVEDHQRTTVSKKIKTIQKHARHDASSGLIWLQTLSLFFLKKWLMLRFFFRNCTILHVIDILKCLSVSLYCCLGGIIFKKNAKNKNARTLRSKCGISGVQLTISSALLSISSCSLKSPLLIHPLHTVHYDWKGCV